MTTGDYWWYMMIVFTQYWWLVIPNDIWLIMITYYDYPLTCFRVPPPTCEIPELGTCQTYQAAIAAIESPCNPDTPL